MIKELTQFVKEIPDTIREQAIGPKPGLHILIRFDPDGNATVINSERYLGKKHGEISVFLKECSVRQAASWMIDTNKCFDLPAKGVHSASPYCFAFKRESWIGGEKYPKDAAKEDVVGRSEIYFQKCFDPKYKLDETEQQRTIQFKNYLKVRLKDLLENTQDYSDLDWGEYIIIYTDVTLNKYQDFNNRYAAEGLFNTANYNIELDGEIHGTSNFLNGFNSDKPFRIHQTASFDITKRISAKEAKALSVFQDLAIKKQFPNPIPLFIEQPELIHETLKLYHRSDVQRITHREIISELWKRTKDLGNYYLLYFSGGVIRDFDFVAKFRYNLSSEEDRTGERKNWIIENITEIKDKDKISSPPTELTTVFDFERVVIRQLFNNTLVKVDDKTGDVSMRYLDDIDPKYYRPALYTLLLKYRKPIYDFIYKSMRASIGRQQFQDICTTGIMDDVKENKEYAIKIKLNIFFSLNQYFDETKNPEIMPSKIEEHKSTVTQLIDNASLHFNSDEAYAFGAGQLIYYLLSQSEAGERTHAVMEPFLQKTNHANFNEAIASILFKYKHAIRFDFNRFNKLAAEVLDYTPEKGLLELRPILLAGYFCPNILYASKKSDSPS